MKKKVFLLIISMAIIHLVTINNLRAQDYSFAYRTNGFEFATLAIDKDCFRVKDMFHELMKVKNDNNLYAIHNKKKDTIYIAKIQMSDYPGANLFKGDDDLLYLNIDTIFHELDTLVNGLNCKKVNINYAMPILNEQEQMVPFDTIRHVLYVAPLFKTITPFSFVSGKLTGLILKSVKYTPTYSGETGTLVQSYVVKEILTRNISTSKMDDNFFKIPEKAKFLKNYSDFLESIEDEFMNVIKGFN